MSNELPLHQNPSRLFKVISAAVQEAVAVLLILLESESSRSKKSAFLLEALHGEKNQIIES